MARKREVISSNIYGTSSTVTPPEAPPPVELDLTRAKAVTRNKILSGTLLCLLTLLLALGGFHLMERARREVNDPFVPTHYQPEIVRLNNFSRAGIVELVPPAPPAGEGILSLQGVQVGGVFHGAADLDFIQSIDLTLSAQKPIQVRSRDDVSYDLLNAARKFLELREYENAEEQLRRILQRDPEDFEAQSLIGTILMSQGKFSEAIVVYEKLIRRDPYKEELHNNLGFAYHSLNDPEKAEKHLSEAVRLNGLYDDARVNLGLLLVRQGRYEKAVEVLTPVVNRNPAMLRAARALGFSLLELGRPMEARLVLEDVNRRRPKEAQICFLIARCYVLEGQGESAVAWLKLGAEAATGEQTRKELQHPVYAGIRDEANFQRIIGKYLPPEPPPPPEPGPPP